MVLLIEDDVFYYSLVSGIVNSLEISLGEIKSIPSTAVIWM